MKFVIIIVIVFVLLIPSTVFAQTGDVSVKHWFITSYENGCSTDNQKSLEFYEKLTSQYLSKQNIHGNQDVGNCVRGIDVANDVKGFESALTNYDLPIIILDGFSGLDYTISTDAFGHWKWQNNQDVIIFASLSPFVESDSGAWTLSHELSHFALHSKGYPQSIFSGWVHQEQEKVNSCVKNNLSLNDCPTLWTTVKSPTGKNIKMMTIYSETDIVTNTEITQTTSTVFDDLLAEMNDSPDQSTQTSSSECFSNYVSKKFSDAISCYNNYLQTNPNDIDALGWLGRSYEGKLEYSSALLIFQEINGIKPNDTNGLNGIARNYDNLGQCEKAIPYYEKTLLIDPNDIEAKTFINLSSLVCSSSTNSITTTESKIFDIKPIISNGFITNYEIDSRQNKLKLGVTMDSNKSGNAQIVIPRELLDSKSLDNDIPFKVTVGGKFVIVDEIATTDSERIIKFSVSSTARNIIITGNESYPNAVVVPEFASVTMLVFVVSIVAILSISVKYNFSYRF
jgi:hypothetical protein